MAKVIVKSHYQVGAEWLVDYVKDLECGCGFSPRETIRIKQKNKPTQTQVENAINKSKGQDV